MNPRIFFPAYSLEKIHIELGVMYRIGTPARRIGEGTAQEP